MQYPQTGLLVIQPTPFCNINCSYCYLPHRSSKNTLSFERAEIIFKKALRFPTVRGSLTVVWHAGEPLVLPVSYYEQMFELIRGLTPPGLTIRHSFQTNGTLISDAWCDLIKRWDLNIGVSIDGPRELHDLYRKQRNGAGSFDRTYEGLRKLQHAGIPFHVISVLTVESMAQPEKLFEFYVENELDYICFNIEEQEGTNVDSKLVGTGNSDVRYRAFLQRFLDLALQCQRPLLVREVEHSMRMIHAHGAPVCNDQNEPFGIISIDCDGNLSTFSPELLGLEHERYGSFCFGNLVEENFEEIAARLYKSTLYADVTGGVRQCADTCDYYGLCGGGAPSNKIFENGSAATTETAHCRTFMRSVDVVLDLIERLPNDLRAALAAGQTRVGAPAMSMWPG